MDGLTWREWAAHIFETEPRAECGGDAEDHDYIIFLGHCFARCREVPTT